MTSSELNEFSRQVEEHLLDHILPFWCGPALDPERGGWMAWLTNDLCPDRSQPRGLILNSRILWAFSAAFRAHGLREYQDMADRAFEIVVKRFWDDEFGGAFWRLNDAWNVVDDSKKIYGQAFCIYALSEYYRAFCADDALDRAKELFELIERYAYDSHNGGYVEVCNRNWSEAGPDARLSEKDMSEKKSMNNHLHMLEALTNLYRVWKDPRVVERLRELVGLFEQRILDTQTSHLHHFFNERWKVRSDNYTFGHDIEASWLLCEAAEELGDESLLDRVRSMALRIAEVALAEGLGTDGGLFYEGRGGRMIDRGRECWPQAEAMVGFVNVWQISGESRFLEAARRVWGFIQDHLVDRDHGEWFWRITDDGKVDCTLPKVSEWKGPYHATRACLQVAARLKRTTSTSC